MWNGPRIVLSVPPWPGGKLIVSTSAETPSTSESVMYSCRVPVVLCPTAVRNPMAFIHSWGVKLVSLTNACRWLIMLFSRNRSRLDPEYHAIAGVSSSDLGRAEKYGLTHQGLTPPS